MDDLFVGNLWPNMDKYALVATRATCGASFDIVAGSLGHRAGAFTRLIVPMCICSVLESTRTLLVAHSYIRTHTYGKHAHARTHNYCTRRAQSRPECMRAAACSIARKLSRANQRPIMILSCNIATPRMSSQWLMHSIRNFRLTAAKSLIISARRCAQQIHLSSSANLPPICLVTTESRSCIAVKVQLVELLRGKDIVCRCNRNDRKPIDMRQRATITRFIICRLCMCANITRANQLPVDGSIELK